MPGSTCLVSTIGASKLSSSDIADRRRIGRVEGSDVVHAGVVHQHIDRPDRRLDTFDQPVDLGGVEQVGDEGVAAELDRQLIECRAVTRRNRHDSHRDRAYSRAMAAPMPRDPPVTSTCAPASCIGRQ